MDSRRAVGTIAVPQTTRRIVTGLVAFVGSLLLLACLAPAVQASTSVPYTDSNATGLLTLCNAQGQPVTSGKLDAQPFVWRTVSSVPAPAGYTSHANATLYAYQPLPYVDSGDWTGGQLTGAATFSNSNHPMTEATAGDQPLSFFVATYPPHLKGFVQLRMYFGAKDNSGDNLGYPTADIQVTGNTWRLVRGGTTPCNVGTAVSTEDTTLSKKLIDSHIIDRSSKATSSAGATPATSGSAASTPSASAGGSATSAASADGSGGSTHRSGLVIGAIVLLALVIGGAVLWRRRFAAGRS